MSEKISEPNQLIKKNVFLTFSSQNGENSSSLSKILFVCPFPNCDKRYSVHNRYLVHLRTHTGERPFKCNLCGKTFNEKGNLKTHINFHSLSRPFKCDICLKTYKTKGHLKDHISIQHMMIKKFKCDECGKEFGRGSTLKAHIRTHTGEKSYKCKIPSCEKFFSEKGNMETHYKRHMKKMLNDIGDFTNVINSTDTSRPSTSDENINNVLSSIKIVKVNCENSQDVNQNLFLDCNNYNNNSTMSDVDIFNYDYLP